MSGGFRGECTVAEVLHIAAQANRRLPSGGRVQRGRSPLWWGLGGTPQNPFRSASRQGSGRMSGEDQDGRTAVRPRSTGIRNRSEDLAGRRGAIVTLNTPGPQMPDVRCSIAAWSASSTKSPMTTSGWRGDGRTAVRPYESGTGAKIWLKGRHSYSNTPGPQMRT